MNQGRIIEYIDQGKFICALCLQDRGNRFHLLTGSNRQVNLSPKRAILVSGSTLDISRPREELLEDLNRAEALRNRLKAQVNVIELWELIRDEKESFGHRYLAQLVFGEAVDDAHLSAVVRALFENRVHFKMKDGRFLPNSGERVEQILRQQQEQARKEALLRQGAAWLREVVAGGTPEPPPCGEEIVRMLAGLALYGKEDPGYKYAKELLSLAGITDIREAKHLLMRLGVWEADENLDLLRLGIETGFTPEQMAETARLAGLTPETGGREDLRDIPVLTIDGPMTRDYDDAVSLEITDEGLNLGIHITDAAALIPPGGPLDRESMDRASSLYLPRRHIAMIPPELSQDVLSLREGRDRRAVSLLARFDRAGNLTAHRFVASVIRVRHRLDYDDVNRALAGEGETPAGDADFFGTMHDLALRLRRDRLDRGALNLSLPELHFKWENGSGFRLELMEQDTPSRIIVSEFMILYNWLAARLCRDERVPVLYRTQAPPGERLSVEETGYLFYVFRQRRKLSPLKVSTAPEPHSGLGLDAYAQSTSPIRRYLDLVVQRQISTWLSGREPVYDEERLKEIWMRVEPVIKSIAMVKRNRLRYWTIKYLDHHRDEVFRALVLDELKRKYRVVLKDLLLVAEMRREDGLILSPGEEIAVKVKKSDPWEDLVELSYAGD